MSLIKEANVSKVDKKHSSVFNNIYLNTKISMLKKITNQTNISYAIRKLLYFSIFIASKVVFDCFQAIFVQENRTQLVQPM